jgi:hypothetical protein
VSAFVSYALAVAARFERKGDHETAQKILAVAMRHAQSEATP